MPESNSRLQLERILEQKAPDVWKKLPGNLRPQLLQVVESITVSKSYSGPIPAPEDLEALEKLAPGSAARILEMAEAQSKHRIEIEKVVITSQQKQSERGQHYALAVTVCLVIAGGILTALDHNTVGGIIFGTTILGVAATFVTGKVQQFRNLKRKDEASK